MTRPTRVEILTREQIRRERRSRFAAHLIVGAAALWALWMLASFLSAALPGGH